MTWEDFFTKYSRRADGTLYYQADPSMLRWQPDWYQAEK